MNEISKYDRYYHGGGSYSGDSLGVFDIINVLLLREWLFGISDTHFVNWKAADFLEYNKLDVFDLFLIERKLSEK